MEGNSVKPVKDEKYIVFNREKFLFMMKVIEQRWDETIVIDDAVVIRKQDVFAPPALEAYSNAIQCVIEALEHTQKEYGVADPELAKQIVKLRLIADYFKAQADDAYDFQRGLPD